MTEETLYRPSNQERDDLYNREPGIVVVPGSNYANEMQKFEQFPSKYGNAPGNPYVYRPFPKMVYRAEEWKGKVACLAAPPDPSEFANPAEFQRTEEQARKFTDRCCRVVQNETEYLTARADGWRENPADAMTAGLERQRSVGTAAAERNYDDRNMGELAKREIIAEVSERGGEHVAEMPRRRGRPRKNAV
jgi:hypothetical protein